MTKGKSRNWDWAAEWSKAIKTFPDWSPDLRAWTDSDHPVLTRLCTYPEMGMVWLKLYEWWVSAQKNSGKPYNEIRFDGQCVSVITKIALLCTAPKLGVRTLTNSKRQKLIEKMTGQAKALSDSLRDLVVPESISYYIDWETRFEEVRQQQSAILCENFLKETEEYIEALDRLGPTYSDDHEPFDDDSMGDFQEPHEKLTSEESDQQTLTHWREIFPHFSDFSDEQIIEKIRYLETLGGEPPPTDWDEDLMSVLQERLERQILHQIKIPSEVSIYDILNRVIGLENQNFPEPVVKKAKGENAPKLLTIRLYAEFFHRVAEHDPRSSDGREVIARLARTVLDDPSIGEDTVKDALKGYQV